MSRWRRAAALLGVVAQSVLGSSLGAQASISLVISGAAGDSMPPAPSFQIATFGTRPDLSYTITLDLSTESAFSRPFFNAQLDSLSATIHLDSLLVQHQRIFIRARLIENQFAGVGVVVDATTRNFAVQGWLKLDSPAQQRTVILNTRTPLFAWSSPGISLPPAPWQYDLTVLNRNTGEQRTKSTTADSVIFDSLEANTSYKWWVTAHAQNSRGNTTVTDTSSGTFVIVSATQPTFTLFYQNFPNPFGRGQRLAMTCFWFDLDHAATVGLTIYDLRLHKVRTIVPGPIGGSQLGAGAYGRTNVDATSGCDNRLSWDGRDDRGNFVAPGVYMARFVADGKSTVIKMLFTGPP